MISGQDRTGQPTGVNWVIAIVILSSPLFGEDNDERNVNHVGRVGRK